MPREHRVTASTTVAAPPAAVWALLCDTARYEEWVETTLAVLTADGPLRLGATYVERTRLSGFFTATTAWTVEELEPVRRVVLAGTGAPTVTGLVVSFEVEPSDEGTELSSTYAYVPRFGALGAVLEFAVKNNVTAEQRRTLRTLAILAEREVTGGGPSR